MPNASPSVHGGNAPTDGTEGPCTPLVEEPNLCVMTPVALLNDRFPQMRGVELVDHRAIPVIGSRRSIGPPAPDLPRMIPLTPREAEVLQELALGSSYADIAGVLYITENTVKTHLGSVYRKLGVTRRPDALRAARARGLL